MPEMKIALVFALACMVLLVVNTDAQDRKRERGRSSSERGTLQRQSSGNRVNGRPEERSLAAATEQQRRVASGGRRQTSNTAGRAKTRRPTGDGVQTGRQRQRQLLKALTERARTLGRERSEGRRRTSNTAGGSRTRPTGERTQTEGQRQRQLLQALAERFGTLGKGSSEGQRQTSNTAGGSRTRRPTDEGTQAERQRQPQQALTQRDETLGRGSSEGQRQTSNTAGGSRTGRPTGEGTPTERQRQRQQALPERVETLGKGSSEEAADGPRIRGSPRKLARIEEFPVGASINPERITEEAIQGGLPRRETLSDGVNIDPQRNALPTRERTASTRDRNGGGSSD